MDKWAKYAFLRVVGGGDHICICVYVYIYIYEYFCICTYVYMFREGERARVSTPKELGQALRAPE